MKTYWFQPPDYPNLGDFFTVPLLKRRYGVVPQPSMLPAADILATGSVLGWHWSVHNQGRSHVLHVVGSGFLRAEQIIHARHDIVIHSVRGFLSKMKLRDLDSPAITVGDPGLLISEIAQISPSQNRVKYGVILHHSNVGDEKLQSFFPEGSVKFLDIRTDDLDAFASEMASCEIILSESLHGLIFADSLGIPNVWITFNSLDMRGTFKYFDYFSSVGRDPGKMLIVQGRISEENVLANLSEPDKGRVEALQRSIDAKFKQAIDQIEFQDNYLKKYSYFSSDSEKRYLDMDLTPSLKHFRVEFDADLSEDIKFREVLLFFDLCDSEGVKVSNEFKIKGVTPTTIFGGGHYRYVDIKAGRKKYVESVYLPEDVWCKNVKLVLRTKPRKDAYFSNIVIRRMGD